MRSSIWRSKTSRGGSWAFCFLSCAWYWSTRCSSSCTVITSSLTTAAIESSCVRAEKACVAAIIAVAANIRRRKSFIFIGSSGTARRPLLRAEYRIGDRLVDSTVTHDTAFEQANRTVADADHAAELQLQIISGRIQTARVEQLVTHRAEDPAAAVVFETGERFRQLVGAHVARSPRHAVDVAEQRPLDCEIDVGEVFAVVAIRQRGHAGKTRPITQADVGALHLAVARIVLGEKIEGRRGQDLPRKLR